jgi:hypothetical protein
MRRIASVLALLAVMASMLVVSAVPAMADPGTGIVGPVGGGSGVLIISASNGADTGDIDIDGGGGISGGDLSFD